MKQYLVRRFINMLIALVVISFVSFAIIQLPPGDYLTTYLLALEAEGFEVNDEMVEELREEFGLDRPFLGQYFKWIGNFVRGNMGRSFIYNAPVSELVGERIALTFVISVSSLLFVWIVAFPVGIYSAVRQYSVGDYAATFLSYVGLATPNFLLALILMYVAFRYLGLDIGGLFSVEYRDAPWSLAKVLDCWSTSGCRRWCWAPRARRGWCGSCAPTCWMSCASSTSSRRGPRGWPRPP